MSILKSGSARPAQVSGLSTAASTMATSASALLPAVLVRVESGTHLGAEVSLTAGRWSIGPSADCDLVLLDFGVGSPCLVIEVSMRQVKLSKDVAAVVRLLDERMADSAGKSLAPNKTFFVGAVAMSWAPASAGSYSTRSFKPRRSRRLAGVTMSALLIVLAGAAWLVLARTQMSAAHASVPAASALVEAELSRERIQRQLAAIEGAELEVDIDARGRALVRGWVLEPGQSHRLRASMAGERVQMQLHVASEQVRFADDYLRGLGHRAQASYLGAGRLRVLVQTHNESQLREDMSRLRQAAPALSGIDLVLQPVEVRPGDVQKPMRAEVKESARLEGVDSVVAVGRRRYLTVSGHYVFEGGILKSGAVVRGIDQALRELQIRTGEGRFASAGGPVHERDRKQAKAPAMEQSVEQSIANAEEQVSTHALAQPAGH